MGFALFAIGATCRPVPARGAPILLACALALTANAQTMYKCQNNGKIEYTDHPCWSGTEVKRIAPNGGPTKEDIERARMRAAAERARNETQERQAAQERKAASGQSVAAGNDTAAGVAASRDAADEKVLTHDRSGWDRKPRGQISAEEEARQQGRERARSGAGDAGTVSKAGQGTWGSEKTLTHSPSGWNTSTRSGAVQSEADRAYRDEKARLLAPATPAPSAIAPRPAPAGPSIVTTCDAGGCWDSSGQRYTTSGPSLVRSDGKVCQRVGATVQCN